MRNTLDDLSTAMSSQLAQPPLRHALCGLLTRRERWALSWLGRLILASALLFAVALCIRGVYPFLAITHRVNANALVVEGWIHEYAIRAAVKEFQSNHYQRAFTTGGPVVGSGGYINDFCTSASVGADLLMKNGLANRSVEMVPSQVMDRDRTYSSAVALRNWFRDHNIAVPGINIVTEDLHARRTRLLFQKAFGKHVQVGIIAVANVDYPANRWWYYSEGVKDVISEFAAYLYARVLSFAPQAAGSGYTIVGNGNTLTIADGIEASTSATISAPIDWIASTSSAIQVGTGTLDLTGSAAAGSFNGNNQDSYENPYQNCWHSPVTFNPQLSTLDCLRADDGFHLPGAAEREQRAGKWQF